VTRQTAPLGIRVSTTRGRSPSAAAASGWSAAVSRLLDRNSRMIDRRSAPLRAVRGTLRSSGTVSASSSLAVYSARLLANTTG